MSSSHSLKNHFNIILSTTPGSSKWPPFLSQVSPPKPCTHLSSPHTCYMPCPSSSSQIPASAINKRECQSGTHSQQECICEICELYPSGVFLAMRLINVLHLVLEVTQSTVALNRSPWLLVQADNVSSLWHYSSFCKSISLRDSLAGQCRWSH